MPPKNPPKTGGNVPIRNPHLIALKKEHHAAISADVEHVAGSVEPSAMKIKNARDAKAVAWANTQEYVSGTPPRLSSASWQKTRPMVGRICSPWLARRWRCRSRTIRVCFGTLCFFCLSPLILSCLESDRSHRSFGRFSFLSLPFMSNTSVFLCPLFALSVALSLQQLWRVTMLLDTG